MSFVMRDVTTGLYLVSFDPDVHAPPPAPAYPSGDSVWTDDPAAALGFATRSDALQLYLSPSITVPLRPDGKPNRPLSARTVEILERPT